MSWWVGLAVVEAAIVVGSFIEAKARRQIPVLRWAWWHVAIVWAVWMATVWVLVKALDRSMVRSAETMIRRSQSDRATRAVGFQPDPKDSPAFESSRTLRRWSPSWARLSSSP